jgi:hypothetical protein
LSIIPTTGFTTGGINITVTGTLFSSAVAVTCKFGTVVSSVAVVVSETTIVCELPPTPNLSQDTTVAFSLVLNGREYSVNDLAFIYNGTQKGGFFFSPPPC